LINVVCPGKGTQKGKTLGVAFLRFKSERIITGIEDISSHGEIVEKGISSPVQSPDCGVRFQRFIDIERSSQMGCSTAVISQGQEHSTGKCMLHIHEPLPCIHGG